MSGIFTGYISDLKREFEGYGRKAFQKDLLAGLTVCAVALPLALAFGVQSGASAAAGLITAIISGLAISAFSGASFQISGPTGAMTAILISLVARFGLSGVFAATLMAGVILLLAGIFKFGRVVGFIPSPVISGFTSGIAVIIALGQADNFFGVTSRGETTVSRLFSYAELGFSPSAAQFLIGLGCVALMILWPKKLAEKFPGSLLAIIVATAANLFFHFGVPVVGAIPQTFLPDARLRLSEFPADRLYALLPAAVSIAALAMIESLLCGASGARMKAGREKFDGDRELVAQGIGNILIPFFGGVPATAAIARTSVAIKSGGVTRLTGMLHSLFLLISMFLLAPVMSEIPLSALAGVLIVTAWRMNEWESIRYITSRRFKGAMFKFLVTMAATVLFDLTIAILAGVCFSVVLFVIQISDIDISIAEVDKDRLRMDIDLPRHLNLSSISVVYFTGPLFFGTVQKLESRLHHTKADALIFSMRGVPLIDTSGVLWLSGLCEKLRGGGVRVVFSGVQPRVMSRMERGGLVELLGQNSFFWDSEQAICGLCKTPPKDKAAV